MKIEKIRKKSENAFDILSGRNSSILVENLNQKPSRKNKHGRSNSVPIIFEKEYSSKFVNMSFQDNSPCPRDTHTSNLIEIGGREKLSNLHYDIIKKIPKRQINSFKEDEVNGKNTQRNIKLNKSIESENIIEVKDHDKSMSKKSKIMLADENEKECEVKKPTKKMEPKVKLFTETKICNKKNNQQTNAANDLVLAKGLEKQDQVKNIDIDLKEHNKIEDQNDEDFKNFMQKYPKNIKQKPFYQILQEDYMQLFTGYLKNFLIDSIHLTHKWSTNDSIFLSQKSTIFALFVGWIKSQSLT